MEEGANKKKYSDSLNTNFQIIFLKGLSLLVGEPAVLLGLLSCSGSYYTPLLPQKHQGQKSTSIFHFRFLLRKSLGPSSSPSRSSPQVQSGVV